nr:hypothetical protein [Tanacetum cinerariifolium]
MITILEKTEHNIDFHPIVDFIEASHIRYALTINPTVYVSHIRQFWSTARIETTIEETNIPATVDDLEISGLKARVKILEDKERGRAVPAQEDAPIKGEEVGVERSTEIGTVSVSPIAAATTVGVPTVNKGKEKVVESEVPKKRKLQEQIDTQVAKEIEEDFARENQRLNEQIARDLEIARLYTEDELKLMIGGLDRSNEVIVKHMKGLKLDQGSAKRINTSEDVSEEDLKGMKQLVHVEEVDVKALQFDKEDLHQLWALIKETLSIRQAIKDKEKELWVELKRLFELDFEDQLWTHNQNLMHNPLDWKLYDTCGVHHVFTKDQEIFMLVERDYPLRRGLAIVMICNKLQVENYSQMANDLILKIHNIANSPR